jgi:chaperonin GroES
MIKPYGKTLVILRDKVETESLGGIILPEEYTDRKLNQGKVVEIGTDPEITIEIGSMIVFNDFAGTEVEWDGVEYLIIPEEETLCILPEED